MLKFPLWSHYTYSFSSNQTLVHMIWLLPGSYVVTWIYPYLGKCLFHVPFLFLNFFYHRLDVIVQIMFLHGPCDFPVAILRSSRTFSIWDLLGECNFSCMKGIPESLFSLLFLYWQPPLGHPIMDWSLWNHKQTQKNLAFLYLLITIGNP